MKYYIFTIFYGLIHTIFDDCVQNDDEEINRQIVMG